VVGCPGRRGEVDLRAALHEFARRGWSNVLIEGGAKLAGAALRAGIVDRVAFFAAPILVGAGTPAIEGLGFERVRDAIALGQLSARRLGGDLLIEAEIAGRRRASRRRS